MAQEAGLPDWLTPGVFAGWGLSTERLTRQEFRVLQGLCRGWRDREIAAQLVVSERTVRMHVRAVLGKLGVTCRTAAAVLVWRAVWLAVQKRTNPDGAPAVMPGRRPLQYVP